MTLQGITDLGNATTNVVRFTNTTTGFVSTANIEVGGNVKIDGLTAGAVPYVASDNFLKDSFISTTTDTTVITSNLDVTGNIFMRGERFVVESETKLINDAIIGIANNNTTATTDVGILMQRPTANVALIHHGGTDKFTIGYTQNNLTATDITNDTTNIINVNVLGELYVQNNIVLGSSGKYYGDGSTLTNVPTSTEHSALNTRVGDIETALGGNGPTFPDFNLDGVVDRGNTTSNTILLTNATTGIVATGNVEALKFIGDGTSLTGLTLQHITDLGNVTTSNIQAAYFKGDGSELENITLDNVVNKGNATSNVIHLSNATKGLEADGNIHASFFIGDGSELTNVTLDNVVNKGNTTSNTVQFTNTGTSLTASGNVAIDGNVSSTTALVSNVATMGTTKTFVVTASGGYFHIDGVDRPALELHEHQTYIFDVSSLSGSQHVFRLSETVQGTHGGGAEYTDGVDHSVANKLILTVQTGASDLYYYCTNSNHPTMGNTSPCKVYSTAELVVSGRVDVSGNVDVDSNINVLGNVYANSFVGNGAGLTNVPTVSTLQDVTTNGPSTSQTIQLTNTGTSLTASGGVTASYFTGDGSNVAIGAMTATTVPYVDSNKQLRDSHIKNAPDATIINSNLQVTGNLFVTGNTFAVNSENMLVNDRIIGIANNNAFTNLDMGLIMQYPTKNVAVIHHGIVAGSPHNGQLTIGYTQNNMTTNNITQDTTNDITLNVWGSVISSNYFGDGTTLTGVALSNATIISNSAGITSGFATGDLLYASANNVLDKLPISSTTGHVLKVSAAGIPEWAQETGGSGSSQWQGTTDIYYTNGNVGISNTNPGHDLSVGTNFFVHDSGSNVVVVDGGVKATKYYGDGSALTGINATGGGQWTGTTEIYFDGNVGVANTNPGHDLSVGTNFFVDDSGSNVVVVDGGVKATKYYGDGSALTGINATGGGQWTGTTEIYFDGNVGVANTNPGHDLSVGSNLFVDDDGSNVLVISGNAAMTALTLGEVSIVTSYGLDDILSTSNISSNTIQLTEQTTGLVATGNVEAFKFIGNGSELTNISLEQVTNYGNVTSNTIEFSNATTGLVTTANVEVGGALIVSGNATVSSNLTVSGNVSDLNIVSNVNMLHTANTASIKLNSNVVTEFPRSKKLIKYPRVAMSQNDESGTSGYVTNASSWENQANNETYGPWNNFNGILNDSAWQSYPRRFSQTTGDWDGTTTAPYAISLVGGTTIYGEWVELKIPNKIQLHTCRISPLTSTTYPNLGKHRSPRDGYILGRVGATGNWTVLKSWSGFIGGWEDLVLRDFDIENPSEYYDYFRVVWTAINGNNNYSTSAGAGYASSGEIEFLGVPEYDPDAHGTDVVVKSVPNVPNTDWLEVYYDAKGLTPGAVGSSISGLGGTTISATKLGDPQVSNDAFVFDGSGDAIVSGATSLSGNPPLSYSVWFKTNSISSGTGSNSIVQIGYSASYKSLGFRIRGLGETTKPGNYRFYVWTGATGEPIDTDIKAEIGTWTHATVVYDGLNSKLYIDGKFAVENTNTTSDLALDSGAKVTLGNYIDSNGALYDNTSSYDGSIANVRLFNRALTTDEIYQLYAYQEEDFGHSTNSMTLKAGRLGIGTSEPKAALDVRGRIMREYNPGEIIEELNAICDGSTVTVQSGSYTMANITAYQSGTTSHQVITGSTINYTPPPGTKRVYYRFWFKWDAYRNRARSHFQFQIDDVVVTPSKNSISSASGSDHQAAFPVSVEYTINCNHHSDDASNGKFKSWTGPKELECTFRDYSHPDDKCLIHVNEWTDGTGNDSIQKPHLTVRAIA